MKWHTSANTGRRGLAVSGRADGETGHREVSPEDWRGERFIPLGQKPHPGAPGAPYIAVGQ